MQYLYQAIAISEDSPEPYSGPIRCVCDCCTTIRLVLLEWAGVHALHEPYTPYIHHAPHTPYIPLYPLIPPYSCQLVSRSWHITSPSEEEEEDSLVEGPGVVGLYPLLRAVPTASVPVSSSAAGGGGAGGEAYTGGAGGWAFGYQSCNVSR